MFEFMFSSAASGTNGLFLKEPIQVRVFLEGLVGREGDWCGRCGGEGEGRSWMGYIYIDLNRALIEP